MNFVKTSRNLFPVRCSPHGREFFPGVCHRLPPSVSIVAYLWIDCRHRLAPRRKRTKEQSSRGLQERKLYCNNFTPQQTVRTRNRSRSGVDITALLLKRADQLWHWPSDRI